MTYPPSPRKTDPASEAKKAQGHKRGVGKDMDKNSERSREKISLILAKPDLTGAGHMRCATDVFCIQGRASVLVTIIRIACCGWGFEVERHGQTVLRLQHSGCIVVAGVMHLERCRWNVLTGAMWQKQRSCITGVAALRLKRCGCALKLGSGGWRVGEAVAEAS